MVCVCREEEQRVETCAPLYDTMSTSSSSYTFVMPTRVSKFFTTEDVSNLHINQFAMIRHKPCRIQRITWTSGLDGKGSVLLVGSHLFSTSEVRDYVYAPFRVKVPIVEVETYHVIHVDTHSLTIFDDETADCVKLRARACAGETKVRHLIPVFEKSCETGGDMQVRLRRAVNRYYIEEVLTE